MRAKTVIAIESRNPFSCPAHTRRADRRTSHRPQPPRNRRRAHRVASGGRSIFAHSPSPCCCVSEHRDEAGTIAFRFYAVSGRWLEQCGFAIGARYYVTVAQGKLMLTLVEPDESDEPMGE